MNGTPARKGQGLRPSDEFLAAPAYIERYRAAAKGIHQSLLALLGLIAFWLAIEISFDRFVEMRKAETALDQTSRVESDLIKMKRDIDKKLSNDTFRKSLLTDKSAEAERLSAEIADTESRLKDVSDRLSEAKAKREQTVSEKRLFRRESVDLSIAGTRLPSRPAWAPVLWLMTALCWLMYFSARQVGAHRNLAALVACSSGRRLAFGTADDGSMWISPLPAKVTLPLRTREVVVGLDQIRHVLGWDKASERRYRAATAIFAAIFVLVLLRLWFISYSFWDYALVARWPSPSIVGIMSRSIWEHPLSDEEADFVWSAVAFVISTAIAAVCLIYAFNIPLRREAEVVEGAPFTARRTFVLGMAAALVAGTWRLKDAASTERLPHARRTADAPARAAGETGKKGTSGRFIAVRKRLARAARLMNGVEYSEANTLLVVTPPAATKHPRKRTRLLYAPNNKFIRFFGGPPPIRPFARVDLMAIESRIGKVADGQAAPSRLSSAKTLAFEMAAIDLYAAGKKNEAVDLLWAAARLTLSDPGRVNLRLLDLLAGLLVRTSRRPIEDLIEVAEKAALKSARLRKFLLERKPRWGDQNSRWRARWSDTKAVKWHYCCEVELPPSARDVPLPKRKQPSVQLA